MRPLRKLRDRLTRGHVNRLVDSVQNLEKRVREMAARERRARTATLTAWAYNGTGVDLRMGDAAAVTGNGAAEVQGVALDGALLTLAEFDGAAGDWAVALDLIPAGQAGQVAIGGLCMARATGSGACVDAPASGVVLERGATGSKIVQVCNETVAGGGETWVLVRVGRDVSAGGTTLAGYPGETYIEGEEGNQIRLGAWPSFRMWMDVGYQTITPYTAQILKFDAGRGSMVTGYAAIIPATGNYLIHARACVDQFNCSLQILVNSLVVSTTTGACPVAGDGSQITDLLLLEEGAEVEIQCTNLTTTWDDINVLGGAANTIWTMQRLY